MTISSLTTICSLGIVITFVLEFLYLFNRCWDAIREQGGVDGFKIMNDDTSELAEITRQVMNDEMPARFIFRLTYCLIIIRYIYCLWRILYE